MNNDRFKFRVWDIEDCSYFEPRDFDDLWLNENAELRVGFYSDATQMIEDYTDNVIIEQCTGLKDKNGNLIFEGDVVKDMAGETYKIIWHNDFIGFVGKHLYQENRLLFLSNNPVKIVGNVHTGENK